MTASVSSSCPGRRPSKSSSAAMSPVSRAAMAASIGASAAKGGSACEQRVSSRKDSAMSATKILWGQILVVSLIVLVTTWTATQWTAWQLGFQPQLGRPWFERSEEHTSELQSLMRISYAVLCLKKQKKTINNT